MEAADDQKNAILARLDASTSRRQWNEICAEVKSYYGGYPAWWFPDVILSGIAQRGANRFSDGCMIKVIDES